MKFKPVPSGERQGKIPLFRFSRSLWTSTQGVIIKRDKLEHFTCYLFGSTILSHVLHSDYKAAVILLVVGFLWEVKDGLVPYEIYGPLGGEGFCWKDLTANAAGICIGLAPHFLSLCHA